MSPVMDDIRKQMGKVPVYISLDIDALDPAFAPGTGIKFSLFKSQDIHYINAVDIIHKNF